MYCKYCGSIIDHDSIYCCHCGQKLIKPLDSQLEIPLDIKSKAIFYDEDDCSINKGINNTSPDTKEYYDILLRSGDLNNIQLVVAIKELFGYGLYESKDIIKNAPVILRENVGIAQAELMRMRLESAGGKVDLM